MSREGRKLDINGKIPEVGNMIVFNPAYEKGIVKLEIVDFSRAGLPRVYKNSRWRPERRELVSIRTDFIIFDC